MDEPYGNAPRSRPRAGFGNIPYADDDMDYLDGIDNEGRYNDPRYEHDMWDSRTYGRDYHDRDTSSFGRNRVTISIGDRSERITRDNREAAIANGLITHASETAQLHPMRTRDGNYPPTFRTPKPLHVFADISSRELQYLLDVYRLDYGGRSGYSYQSDYYVGNDRGRTRGLIILFEHLGASMLAAHLQHRMREGGSRYGSRYGSQYGPDDMYGGNMGRRRLGW